MPKEIFRFIGTQDPEEGGSPIGIIDLGDRSMLIGTKVATRHLAAAYTFVAEDTGTYFIADAAITFTLPTAAAAFKGCWGTLINGADTTLTLAATTNGDLVYFNDLAANTLALSTSSEKIGGVWKFVCDGTKWYCMPMMDEVQTVSVTT